MPAEFGVPLEVRTERVFTCLIFVYLIMGCFIPCGEVKVTLSSCPGFLSEEFVQKFSTQVRLLQKCFILLSYYVGSQLKQKILSVVNVASC
jgi:hypothetical protein